MNLLIKAFKCIARPLRRARVFSTLRMERSERTGHRDTVIHRSKLRDNNIEQQ